MSKTIATLSDCLVPIISFWHHPTNKLPPLLLPTVSELAYVWYAGEIKIRSTRAFRSAARSTRNKQTPGLMCACAFTLQLPAKRRICAAKQPIPEKHRKQLLLHPLLAHAWTISPPMNRGRKREKAEEEEEDNLFSKEKRGKRVYVLLTNWLTN